MIVTDARFVTADVGSSGPPMPHVSPRAYSVPPVIVKVVPGPTRAVGDVSTLPPAPMPMCLPMAHTVPPSMTTVPAEVDCAEAARRAPPPPMAALITASLL